MSTKETYTLRIQSQPGGPPATVKLRRLLKESLRRHGFRCLDVQQTGQSIHTGKQGDVRS